MSSIKKEDIVKQATEIARALEDLEIADFLSGTIYDYIKGILSKPDLEKIIDVLNKVKDDKRFAKIFLEEFDMAVNDDSEWDESDEEEDWDDNDIDDDWE